MFLFVVIDSDEVGRARGRNLHLKSPHLKYAKDDNQCVQPHAIMLIQNFVIITSSSSYIFKCFL